MTNEDAIEWLKRDVSRLWNTPMNNLHKEALNKAIKALENQCPSKGVDCEDCPANEPCEDAISRQEVLNLTKELRFNSVKGMEDYCYRCIDPDAVEELPPVQPKAKVGHWIETAEEYYKAINEKGGGVNENTDYFVDDIACSECLAKFSVIDNETERFICCPNCGAKMESEE